MSSVFKAVHAESGHEVAVKVLPRSLAKNPTLLQRFLREAKSAESLEHPNIVAIFDRGSEAGRYYLVLELVAGGDLHDRVRDNGPFPIDEAVRVLSEVTEGLKYAAGKGVIHRRHQAGEHPPRQRRPGQADRPRPGAPGGGRGRAGHPRRHHGRHRRLHVARAGARQPGDELPQRHLFARLHRLLPPHRQARRSSGGDLADKLRRHAVAPPPDGPRFAPRSPRGARQADPADDGQEARRPAGELRRAARPLWPRSPITAARPRSRWLP